jgi:hypothetical protein
MTEQQLVDLKRKIDSTKQKQSELKGKKKALLETLLNSFGCKSIAEAVASAKEFDKQAAELSKSIDEGMKKIEQDYDF